MGDNRDPASETGRFTSAVLRVAVAPETFATFLVLALAWVAGFVGVLPKEVWVVDFPALAGALFFDTLAFNEFGIRENAVFYPALVVFGYLEAMVVVAGVQYLRRRLGRVNLAG
ncbi:MULTISPECIES: hypothetical protein [Haloferax]|uniref:Uncharacterized protein n=2 Tax=Haloferax TaxID=2251 RepID=A0A6G1Z3Z0_9EURY|nr:MULTISPECIES: hypothetical protein [Haloferax]KAB1188568.1 hypothetical protein Hfx1149_11185 [Haloferax sp. CBA1149]MRW81266.1 hypothetical protein [Haloferax marinisediminis]